MHEEKEYNINSEFPLFLFEKFALIRIGNTSLVNFFIFCYDFFSCLQCKVIDVFY